MIRMLGAFMFLGLASALPVQQAAAQDVLGGAIVGGALGGIIGGALGRGGGAIAGAAIGATTGAVIAAEAQRRSSGYWAVAITATPTARGCKCSRVIARTDPPILRRS
jgi:outer membrane lipoprotein SlyB